MNNRNSLVRSLAVALIVCVTGMSVPVSAGSVPATLSGTIVAAGTQAPLAGVKLHVADPRSGALRSSSATDATGRFRVADLAPATYQLAVEAQGGLYEVAAPLTVQAGQALDVQVAVNPQTTPAPGGNTGGKKSRGTLWSNPATAALIVLGAAVVVGVLVDSATNDDQPNNGSSSKSLP